jgi:hypothetical protein
MDLANTPVTKILTFAPAPCSQETGVRAQFRISPDKLKCCPLVSRQLGNIELIICLRCSPAFNLCHNFLYIGIKLIVVVLLLERPVAVWAKYFCERGDERYRTMVKRGH